MTDDERIEEAFPSADASGPVKKAEEWAAANGMWPQMIEAPVPRLPQGVQTDGYGTVPVAMGNLRAPRHNPDYWKFAAAKILHGWPEGKELTEAEFDKAVAAACNQTAR